MPRSHHKLSWPFRIALALAAIAFLCWYILSSPPTPPEGAKYSTGDTPTAAIKDALETFKLDNGRYPTTAEGLTPLVITAPSRTRTPYVHT